MLQSYFPELNILFYKKSYYRFAMGLGNQNKMILDWIPKHEGHQTNKYNWQLSPRRFYHGSHRTETLQQGYKNYNSNIVKIMDCRIISKFVNKSPTTTGRTIHLETTAKTYNTFIKTRK